MATKLAPHPYPVLMVALLYLPIASGTALWGTLAGYYSEDDEAVCFGTLGAVTIAIGAVLLALSRRITRMMRGVR